MELDLKLIEASRYGQLEEVKSLIKQGADIHSRANYALCWASMNGHLEVVRYLCEHGADIRTHDDFALLWASYFGHTEVIKYLEATILQEKRIKGLEKLKCL